MNHTEKSDNLPGRPELDLGIHVWLIMVTIQTSVLQRHKTTSVLALFPKVSPALRRGDQWQTLPKGYFTMQLTSWCSSQKLKILKERGKEKEFQYSKLYLNVV